MTRTTMFLLAAMASIAGPACGFSPLEGSNHHSRREPRRREQAARLRQKQRGGR